MIAATEASKGSFSISIDGGPAKLVSCSSPLGGYGLQKTVFESDVLASGSHTAEITVLSGEIDFDAAEVYKNAVPPSTVRVQENSAYLTFSGNWGLRAQIGRFDGHIARQASGIGESMSFSFIGDYFEFLSYKSNSQGMFDIYVDGDKINTEPIDLYNPGADSLFQIPVGGTYVPYGEHTVTLVIAGRNQVSIGNNVYIDAVEVRGEFIMPSAPDLINIEVQGSEPLTIDALANDEIPGNADPTTFTQPESGSVLFENGVFIFTPGEMYVKDDSFTYSVGSRSATVILTYADSIRYEQTFPAIEAGFNNGHAWGTYVFSRFSGGSAIQSSQAGDTIEFTFYGTGIEIIGYKSWSRGIFDATLDGVKTTVDTFDMSYDQFYNTSVYSSGVLTEGYHTLKITVTGERNFLASSTAIDIDAFVVSK